MARPGIGHLRPKARPARREARLEASRTSRSQRMRAVSARESVPERALIRDYVDARFSIGELLLPSLAVILLATFLSGPFPRITLVATAGMYLFLLLVIVAMTLGILGLVVKGLFYLLFTGIGVLLVAFVLGALWMRRRNRRSRHAR